MTYTLSPSSLDLFLECPRCFWLALKKKIKRPESPFPSLPSGMDKVLKEHFDSYRKAGRLPPELSSLVNQGVRLFDDIGLLKEWRNQLKGIRWKDAKGNVFMGAVDEILAKGDKLIVLDFKTRGFPLKEGTAEVYKHRLDIYNFLLRKNGYKTEDYSYLLFYHPKNVNTQGDVIFHTDLVKMDLSVEEAETIFNDAIKLLEGEIPKASEGCVYCHWLKTCQFGGY